MAYVFPISGVRATDSNGDPASGALLYFYLTSSTTPTDAYTSAAETTAHPNPLVADSAGKWAAVFLDEDVDYRIRATTSDGTEIFDLDPVTNAALAGLSGATGGQSIGFKRNTASAVLRTLYDRGQDFITVEDYGAVGDGSTDDSAAIQAAIDENSGDIWFTEGKTYIAENITPKDNITLRGEATIRPPVVPSAPVINYESETTLRNFNIEGLKFIGRGTATEDCIFINDPTSPGSSQTWNESTLERVEIQGFVRGIYCPTPRAVRIRDCHIHLNDKGVVWDFEHFYITHSFISYNDIGLYVGHGTPVGTGIHHFRIIGCAIAHNTTAGIKGNMSSGSIIGTSFIDNFTEGNIVVEALCTNMRIIGNRFEKGTTTPYGIVQQTDTCSRTVIANNTFISHADTDLYGSFAQCTIVGNLSRLATKSFFRNTGSSTNDNQIANNIISECGEEAILISGTTIGIKITGNLIMDAGKTTAGTYDAIALASGATALQMSITGNSVRNTSGTLYTDHAIRLQGATTLTDVTVKDNKTRNLAASTSIDTTSSSITGGNVIMEGNDGAVTEAKGTATVLSGNTSVTVTHGLDYTPGASSIMVTANSDLAGASFYVLNITATTFDIGMSSAPAANKQFAWRAKVSA